MAKMIWLFYFSKIFEFVDTMIMVVKKNNRQISFLHIYHHSSIFVIWWLVTFVAPNGEGNCRVYSDFPKRAFTRCANHI